MRLNFSGLPRTSVGYDTQHCLKSFGSLTLFVFALNGCSKYVMIPFQQYDSRQEGDIIPTNISNPRKLPLWDNEVLLTT